MNNHLLVLSNCVPFLVQLFILRAKTLGHIVYSPYQLQIPSSVQITANPPPPPTPASPTSFLTTNNSFLAQTYHLK